MGAETSTLKWVNWGLTKLYIRVSSTSENSLTGGPSTACTVSRESTFTTRCDLPSNFTHCISLSAHQLMSERVTPSPLDPEGHLTHHSPSQFVQFSPQANTPPDHKHNIPTFRPTIPGSLPHHQLLSGAVFPQPSPLLSTYSTTPAQHSAGLLSAAQAKLDRNRQQLHCPVPAISPTYSIQDSVEDRTSTAIPPTKYSNGIRPKASNSSSAATIIPDLLKLLHSAIIDFSKDTEVQALLLRLQNILQCLSPLLSYTSRLFRCWMRYW